MKCVASGGAGRSQKLLHSGHTSARLLAGLEDDEAVRLGERRPEVELGRGAQREELVVELGALLRRAGVDDDDVVARVGERLGVARLDGVNVVAIEARARALLSTGERYPP